MASTTRLGYRRALINNKGGVGKTLFTVELAAALARRGRRVLAVDMDPQGNLTRRLRATGIGWEHAGSDEDTGPDLAQVLRAPAQGAAADAVTGCGWPASYAHTIHVLPSSWHMEDRVLEAGVPGAAQRLRRALYGVTDHYDWTLIDCPPSMGHLTQMAIAAMDSDQDAVLLPLVPEHDAISGAARAVKLIDQWAEHLLRDGRQVPIAGALVNGVRARVSLHEIRLEDLPDQLTRELESETDRPTKIDVWEPYIPLNARLAEHHDNGRPSSHDRDLVQGGIVARFDQLADILDPSPVAGLRSEISSLQADLATVREDETK